MKSFLKYLLATIVGIIIVHVILFFVFIGLVGAIASFSSPTIEIKDNTILKLSLKTAIPDRASENPFQNFNLMTMSPEKQIGLNKILEYIDNASKDSRIKGIYLDLTEINSNFGGSRHDRRDPECPVEIQEKWQIHLQLHQSGVLPKELLLSDSCR